MTSIALPDQDQPPRVWTVFVDDNFHYQDESERYELGKFESYEEALAECRKIVDRFLEGHSADSADALYELYVSFGEDPYIIGPDKGDDFSAWRYAKQRCKALFASKKSNPEAPKAT